MGSLDNWNIRHSNTQMVVTETTPLLGSGSGYVTPVADGATRWHMTRPSAQYPVGVIIGQAEGLFRLQSQTDVDTYTGFSLFQNQEDITTAGQTAYVVGFHVSSTNVRRLFVGRCTNGLVNAASVSVLQLIGTAPVFNLDTLYGFRVEFAYHTSHGGTLFRLHLGTATDFSDLALIGSYTHTSSPYTTSAWEGCYLVAGDAVASTDWLRVDNISFYEGGEVLG